LKEHFALEPIVGGDGFWKGRGQRRALRIKETNMLAELLGWIVLALSFIALFYALG
jgi:hypothetical protein